MWYRLCALSFSGVLCPAPYLAFPVKTFGVRGEGADLLSRPPQLFSFPLRKRTFRWRAPWEVRVGGSSLFLDLCLQEVSLGRCHTPALEYPGIRLVPPNALQAVRADTRNGGLMPEEGRSVP